MFLTALTFDWSISLGTIAFIVTNVVSILIATTVVVETIKSRLQLVEASLKTHADALKKHDTLLAQYEVRVFDLVGSLQRLIGRFEALSERSHPHDT